MAKSQQKNTTIIRTNNNWFVGVKPNRI